MLKLCLATETLIFRRLLVHVVTASQLQVGIFFFFRKTCLGSLTIKLTLILSLQIYLTWAAFLHLFEAVIGRLQLQCWDVLLWHHSICSDTLKHHIWECYESHDFNKKKQKLLKSVLSVTSMWRSINRNISKWWSRTLHQHININEIL